MALGTLGSEQTSWQVLGQNILVLEAWSGGKAGTATRGDHGSVGAQSHDGDAREEEQVADRKMPPKGIQVLVPQTCDYMTLRSKRDLRM